MTFIFDESQRPLMGSSDSPQSSGLSPDEAFALLGNEIRMNVLRHLGQEGGPMSFSELRDAVEVDDPGQFNYHLDQLVGHFVQRTGDGYELRRPGQRMIEAVLSGAVTEAPNLERTELSWSCMYCGSTPVEIEYRKEQLGVYCTECPGSYGSPETDEDALPEQRQRLFYNNLPPAGLQGRSAEDLLITSMHWSSIEVMHLSVGVCPRCSASVERDYKACKDHDPSEGICDSCERRLGVLLQYVCTNCLFEARTILGMGFAANIRLMDFIRGHGYNPIAPVSSQVYEMIFTYDEEIISMDPLNVEVTFSLGGDEITFHVDEALDTLGESDPYRRGLQP